MFVIFLIIKNNLYQDGVKQSIRKVKKNNYKNYFEYVYNKSKSYKQKMKKVNKKYIKINVNL